MPGAGLEVWSNPKRSVDAAHSPQRNPRYEELQ